LIGKVCFTPHGIHFRARGLRLPVEMSHSMKYQVSHTLNISRITAAGTLATIFVAQCAIKGEDWETWGIDDIQNPEAKKIPITDPKVFIAALIHCIDRTSGREPVHDPDTHHSLLDDVEWNRLMYENRINMDSFCPAVMALAEWEATQARLRLEDADL
jgi:hypothetical protein